MITLGTRMLSYRARHRLSQRQLAELLGEKNINTIYRIENGVHRPHKANEIRLSEKMAKLEAEEKEEPLVHFEVCTTEELLENGKYHEGSNGKCHGGSNND